MPKRIRLGPAGTSGMGYDKGIPHAKKLGLSALEIEFTHGVSMKNESAESAGKIADDNNIALSIHAPYYINLCSDDKAKAAASRQRILQSAERGHFMSRKSSLTTPTPIVFHPGYYMKLTPQKAHEQMVEQVGILMDEVKGKKWNVLLAPETSGRIAQFGSMQETLQLSKDTGCSFCIDFSHIYARNAGKINYDEVFAQLKPFREVHCHFSGIEYGDKGEKQHIDLTKAFFMPLAEHLISAKNILTVINEGPEPFKDITLMKKTLVGLNAEKLLF